MLPAHFSPLTLYIDDKNRYLLWRKAILLDILIGEDHGEPHAGEKFLP